MVDEPKQKTAAPDNKTVMGVLAYIGPLVIISYLIGREDPFVKFHIRQGLVLFVIEIAVWFLSSLFSILLFPLWQVVNIVIIIFAVLGIVNVIRGKEKELPFIGKFSVHFPV